MAWILNLKERCKRCYEKVRKYSIAWFVSYIVEGVLLNLLLHSCRWETEGIEAFVALAEKEPCIALSWHNRLCVFSYAAKRWTRSLKLSLVVSQSGDGEILASIINRHKNMQAIRVAHNARHQALREMVKTLNKEKRTLLITPDGPRGPRYKSKPGTLAAAQVAKAKVMVVSWSASHFWQLQSWDKMIIPKPFSKIFFSVSDPIDLEGAKSLDEKCAQLDQIICSIDQKACTHITSDRSLWPK